MKNISITVLLNAILRVEYMHYATHGDTDHSVPLESMFSTAGYILNSKKSLVARKSGHAVVHSRQWYGGRWAPRIIVIVNEQHHVKCAYAYNPDI